MLRRLYFKPSTKIIFLIEVKCGWPIISIPTTLHLALSPNVTNHLSLGARSKNRSLSPVMYREQPLSIYHLFPIVVVTHICTFKQSYFRVGYPSINGSLENFFIRIKLFNYFLCMWMMSNI